MDKIYLVTRGEYSDYEVIGAFSTEEKAQAVVDAINTNEEYYRDAEIEVLPLDSIEVKPGCKIYDVRMSKEGDTDVRTLYYPSDSVGRTEFRFTTGWNGWKKGVYLVVTRYVETPEHVVKIANELRTQWLAQREWPELKHWNETVQYDL